MNRVAKQYVLPYLWITLASAVYAVGFNWCYEPNQIGFGGITGVGQIVNHLLPWAPRFFELFVGDASIRFTRGLADWAEP